MNRYNSKTARWQQQEKEELRMNKTEFIKVRCTKEEKLGKVLLFQLPFLAEEFRDKQQDRTKGCVDESKEMRALVYKDCQVKTVVSASHLLSRTQGIIFFKTGSNITQVRLCSPPCFGVVSVRLCTVPPE